ncbi:MAG: DUF3793 family protein [Euryarchaeota archaeon]|nr:DUF3793 family protein [Euryarchaeota archaeon]
MDHIAQRIVRCTAATIAGRKPATLMNISNANGGLLDAWDLCKAGIFAGSEIEYYELKRTEKNAIVLFFSRNRLNKVLTKRSVKRFLQGCGYEPGSIEYALEVLSQRYAASGCPPEIGIFLGIPLKDVMGFMGLSSLENTTCGMWRVYGNPVASERTMDEYRSAKSAISKRLFAGEDPASIIRGGGIGSFG